MNQESENRVAGLLQTKFNIKFEKAHHKLGDWGYADTCSEICSNRFVFLEVEEGQKHPCTNVLKVWPYLEDHRKHSVLLVQAFLLSDQNQDTSRIRLSEWIGGKLATRFPKRFRYCRINLDGNFRIMEGNELLEIEFKKFCSKRQTHR